MRKKNLFETTLKEMVTCRHLMLIALFIILYSLYFSPARAQVGTWRAYMSYAEPQQIVKAGNNLYVRASNDLYLYNLTDHSITTYDKITGLSDSYINHIAWNQQAKRLIIVYQNSNIDLMDESGNVTNISAIYRKAMTEDKTIDSLTVDGIYTYLYARFGIVKVNMQRGEISDTYTKNHPEYPTNLPVSNINADWTAYIDVVKTLKPGGPKYNYFNYMKYDNGKLYSTGGGWRDGGQFQRPGTAQILENGEWSALQDDMEQTTTLKYLDATSIVYDPADKKHIFVSTCGTGLYEFMDGKFVKHYDEDNSPMKSSVEGNRNYVRIDGLVFDNNGMLWMTCSSRNNAGNMLLRLNPNTNEWKALDNDELYTNDERLRILKGAFLDKDGFIWICNGHHTCPALLRLNPTTEKITKYNKFINQDEVSYTLNYVHCATQDHEGNIWMGSDQGLFMYNSQQIADATAGFTQVKVPRNDGTDFADYLLSGVNVTCIAIDGGNRKWIGTDGDGLYLISADNMNQIHHFTTENSMLLSDIIESIAINHNSGEVFIGTDQGLCSYLSDATTANNDMSDDNVYAYPNPVTPDYTGLITVVGLSFNADVKILSSSGKLIAEGRSSGGSFTWDGCDKDGKRVASGVYFVAAAKEDGSKGTVCKIAIIK
jgi:sugar lactone lactonase YvrE